MIRHKSATLIALGCLATATAWAQTPSLQAGVGGANGFAVPEGPVVLYDQTTSPAGNGAPDQDFEASFDAYDAEGADDFDVTFADGWDVSRVNTVGTTGTPGGAVVDVNVYSDNGGTPLGGSLVCSYNDVAPTTDNLGSLTVDLPSVCSLPMGLHWVAIQVNQNFGSFGQHFWSNRSVQSNGPSHWRNPGNGFATGCLDWTPQITCGVGGGASPDFLFQIVGTLGMPQETSVSVDKSGVLVGDEVIFTITVNNNGPADATGVTVDDLLPAPFVSDDCGGNIAGDNVTWDWAIGNLANGASVSCNVTVDVSGIGAGGSVENQAVASINGVNLDPNDGGSNVAVVLIGTVLDVPTLGQVGLVVLLLSLLGAGLVSLRRRA